MQTTEELGRVLQAAFWVVCAVAIVAVLLIRRVRMRRADAEHERVERERKVQVQAAARAGTHNARGEPLCRVPGCRDVACRYPIRIARDHSLSGWLRERLGAPARYRPSFDVERELAYCAPHAELAWAEAWSEVIQIEGRRRAELVAAELELARFERVGLDERIAGRIAQHERDLQARAGPQETTTGAEQAPARLDSSA